MFVPYHRQLLDALYRIEYGPAFPGPGHRKFETTQKDGTIVPASPLKFYDETAEQILPRKDVRKGQRPDPSRLRVVNAYLLHKIGMDHNTWCESGEDSDIQISWKKDGWKEHVN